MAVTRIWQVKGRLDAPIDYAMNPEKTENPVYSKRELDSLQDVMDYAANPEKTEKRFYVSGINCNPDTAREQFQTVKEQFAKEGGIIAYHGYQSFSEGETDPETAHKIGIEFAKRVWGDDYQVVVATHLNTKCLHNHFVINSVSFMHGRRCQKKQWHELMKISDEICEKYKLSVVERIGGKRLPYPMYQAEKEGKPTRLVLAKEAIDTAISQTTNMHDFDLKLKELGYYCQFNPERKYWTIRQRNWKKPIRLARIGEEYTNERIMERVSKNPGNVRQIRMQEKQKQRYRYKLPTREQKIRKIKGLKGLYLLYCYKLGYLPKYRMSAKQVHYLYRDDLLKMEQISAEAKLLVRENISTEQELEVYKERVQERLQSRLGERRTLQNLNRRVGTTEAEVEKRKEEIAKINEELKGLRKELRLCRGIESRSKTMEEKIEQEEQEQLRELRKERNLR